MNKNKLNKYISSLLLATSLLNVLSTKTKAKTNDVPYIYEEEKYGESVLGNDLLYYHIENEKQYNDSKKILLNFGIHGFEDAFDNDAQLLVDIATKIIDYYNENYEELGTYELYVIKSSNPDGLLYGTTNNGYGRCQSEGIDLNRDFDYYHIVQTNARNYTLKPFSAKESRALRDVTTKISPDIVVDCHGWLNGYYGDYDLYRDFSKTFPMNYNGGSGSGYYSGWVKTLGAKGMLLEFPWPTGDYDLFTDLYSKKMIEVINNITKNTLAIQKNMENNEPVVYFNNELVEFKRSSIMIEGKNNYSIKDLCDMIDATVFYERGNLVINKDKLDIFLSVNSDVVIINGEIYKLKNPVFINNGKAFMPIRDFCELLGYSLEWENFSNEIHIGDSPLKMTLK